MVKEKRGKEPPMRISRDAALMLTCGIFSLRSTCPKGNGALLAQEGHIISTGYNGAPAGQPHCLEAGCILDEEGHCKRTVHAEVNVVATAAKLGVSTKGSILYCTTAPCPTCSKLIVNSGIIRVVYGKPYSDMSGIELLEKCKIKVEKFNGGDLSGPKVEVRNDKSF